MSKKQMCEVLNLVSLTVPFLMITATFIGLAYTYGHAFTPFPVDNSFEFARMGYTHLP